MENVIRLAKRIIPVEQIALFEGYVPSDERPLQTQRDFKSRIVLLDRYSVLSEETPEQLTEANGFRFVEKDGVGTNPAIAFRIEAFEAVGEFKPTKAFQSRLSWTDHSGNDQSKLMLASPEELLAVVVRGELVTSNGKAARQPRRPRGNRRSRQPTRSPA